MRQIAHTSAGGFVEFVRVLDLHQFVFRSFHARGDFRREIAAFDLCFRSFAQCAQRRDFLRRVFGALRVFARSRFVRVPFLRVAQHVLRRVHRFIDREFFLLFEARFRCIFFDAVAQFLNIVFDVFLNVLAPVFAQTAFAQRTLRLRIRLQHFQFLFESGDFAFRRIDGLLQLLDARGVRDATFLQLVDDRLRVVQRLDFRLCDNEHLLGFFAR